jgi:hypothetical protein
MYVEQRSDEIESKRDVVGFSTWQEQLEKLAQRLIAQKQFTKAKEIYRSPIIQSAKKIKVNTETLKHLLDAEAAIKDYEIGNKILSSQQYKWQSLRNFP